jgi:hypothetical protein
MQLIILVFNDFHNSVSWLRFNDLQRKNFNNSQFYGWLKCTKNINLSAPYSGMKFWSDRGRVFENKYSDEYLDRKILQIYMNKENYITKIFIIYTVTQYY